MAVPAAARGPFGTAAKVVMPVERTSSNTLAADRSTIFLLKCLVTVTLLGRKTLHRIQGAIRQYLYKRLS